MFNWFKSKVELKKASSIMSSYHNKKGLKIGSEIIVPINFECLFFYKGKHYTTLPAGKYKMEKKNFLELVERQQKSKSNTKYIKCVCHYVSTSNQKIEITFKKQIYIVEFKIDNTVDFANLALLYTYKVDDDYTLNTLNDLFYELLLYHKGNYKDIKNDALADYGISIISFLPTNHKSSIFKKSSNKNKPIASEQSNSTSTEKELSQNTPTTAQATTTQSQETDNNSSNAKDNEKSSSTSSTTANVSTFAPCPKCNNIPKFSTTYCIRCGYKLK